jgi:23S rRNA (pseudouridine1915-N3)-methyltransferase
MYKIKILTIGKTKEAWLDEAMSEYLKRLKPMAEIELLLAKNNDQLMAWVEKEPSVICLDSTGSLLESPGFSKFFLQEIAKGGSRLAFVIGGAEGLPEKMKSQYPLLSLSPLTFTHQMARLILVEQIYRALEIEKGSQYHK